MSNCIMFENGSEQVSFPKDSFDVEEFLKTYNEKIIEKNEYGNVWQWFLFGNWSILDHKLVISFGRSKSSHTWRDFDGTIRELSKFIKKPVKHKFIISDEMDDFKSFGVYDYTINKGTFSDGCH